MWFALCVIFAGGSFFTGSIDEHPKKKLLSAEAVMTAKGYTVLECFEKQIDSSPESCRACLVIDRHGKRREIFVTSPYIGRPENF